MQFHCKRALLRRKRTALLAILALAGALALPNVSRASAPDRRTWIAVGLFNGNLNKGSRKRRLAESCVAFFNIKSDQYRSAIWLHGKFPFFTAAPNCPDFLVAWRIGDGAHTQAKVVEFNPQIGRVVASRKLSLALGDPNPSPFWWIKLGPDGVLWVINKYGIQGLKWPSLRIVCTYHGPAQVGVPSIYPIAGGVVLVDTLPLEDTKLSATQHPRVYFLSERGKLNRVVLPPGIVGVPLLMSAQGRTLFGMTAFGGRYLRLTFDRHGKISASLEKAIFRKDSGLRVMGFHRLGHGIGVVLASDGGTTCEICKIALSSGKIINRVHYRFGAEDFATADGRVLLVGPGGSIRVVASSGKVIHNCPPPLLTTGVVR